MFETIKFKITEYGEIESRKVNVLKKIENTELWFHQYSEQAEDYVNATGFGDLYIIKDFWGDAPDDPDKICAFGRDIRQKYFRPAVLESRNWLEEQTALLNELYADDDSPDVLFRRFICKEEQ